MNKNLQILQNKPNNWKAARDLLREYREKQQRNSFEIMKYGLPLINKKSKTLSKEELFEVMEQVFLAGLDVNLEESNALLLKLQKQFPKSLRVTKLSGLFEEAVGNWKKAENIYQSILKNNPSDQIAQKRLVCISKAQGNTKLTIQNLNKYLSHFQGDTEAWEELLDLYLSQQCYSKALFCCEELILAEPDNYQHHYQIANIYYTIGKRSDLIKARQYYAHSIKLLTEQNLKSFYGLYLTTNKLKSLFSRNLNQSETQINEQLLQFAKDKIKNFYLQKEDNNTKTTFLKLLETDK
ncbi:tetratricopeptide repeat protein [Anaeramoeba flamelloides]|uniref:ER membrane protein complex subunit 2 n=1 Tax=Anaeramoeba flamelloides TaxID=1746091 RepID=A0AAV7Y5R7_9EUKA|nr:tetratricopeptide repeat protein [Anaeramoeba flamelloides]KAJ6250526.1 tetratricopeptide repeat protein [Anaeramoeba flamelloides]